MDVVFFPRKDYDVEICAHRLGKSMTYTEQTDGQQNVGQYESYQWFMPLAKARNIKVGCFLGLNTAVSPAGGLKEDYENGKIWLDAYSYAPNIAEKIAHGGTVTQEEWNTAYIDYLLPNFYNFTGKKPVALSYSYGNTTFMNYITQFLGGRNSAPSGNFDTNTFPTDYGVGYGNPNNELYSFSRYKSKASTMRWYDAAKSTGHSFPTELQIVSNIIDAAKINHGWVNNFTHWHNVVNDGNQSVYVDYLDLLAEKNINNDIWFCGYGEALAYLVYKQLITKISMYSPKLHQDNQLVIRLDARNTLNIDTDLLQIPISIKFSTTGTPLEGYQIKSRNNLISLGNNQYVIEIPYSEFPYAVINKDS